MFLLVGPYNTRAFLPKIGFTLPLTPLSGIWQTATVMSEPKCFWRVKKAHNFPLCSLRIQRKIFIYIACVLYLMTKSQEIVKAFEGLKDRKVVESNSTASIVLEVFKAYPTTAFVQKDFVDRLGKRNAHVNTILRGLVDKKVIVRTGSPRQYFYQLAK